MNFKKQVLKNWQLLDAIAHKRFPDENLASEALLFALDHLEKNNWQRLKKFNSEKATFKTYLFVIVRRLFEDYRKSKFGNVNRPPQWLKAMGPLWLKIWHLLCLERQELPDVIEIMKTMAPQGYDQKNIEEAALTIKSEVKNCGQQRGQTIPCDEEQIDYFNTNSDEQPANSENQAIKNEQGQVLGALTYHLLDSEGNCNAPFSSPNYTQAQKAHQALSQVKLSSQELLILRMVFQDGLKIVAAGKLLGLRPNQVHGKSKRLIKKLRKALKKAGVGFEDGI